MIFSPKKAIAISSLLLGALGVYFGYQSFKDETDFSEVLEYVEDHPDKNEEIVNYALQCKIKRDIPYSGNTLKNFSEIVLFEAIRNQIQQHRNNEEERTPNKLEKKIGPTPNILNSLTPEQKWDLIKEGLEYKSGETVDDFKEISSDFYEKFQETKLYESLGGKNQ